MRAYGISGLTVVDRLGVFLSRRRIRGAMRGYGAPDVLDIGCGHHATQLRDLAPHIRSGVGIESNVSDEAKAVGNLRFIEDGAERALPTLEPGSFDVVMMISVLEHVWEPLDVLRECRRVLRPNGSLVLNVPNWRGKTFLELSAFRLKPIDPRGRRGPQDVLRQARPLAAARPGRLQVEPDPHAVPQVRAQPLRGGEDVVTGTLAVTPAATPSTCRRATRRGTSPEAG